RYSPRCGSAFDHMAAVYEPPSAARLKFAARRREEESEITLLAVAQNIQIQPALRRPGAMAACAGAPAPADVVACREEEALAAAATTYDRCGIGGSARRTGGRAERLLPVRKATAVDAVGGGPAGEESRWRPGLRPGPPPVTGMDAAGSGGPSLEAPLTPPPKASPTAPGPGHGPSDGPAVGTHSRARRIR
ncbi:unnamed protein product, partial [Lampetra fluviatilis]